MSLSLLLFAVIGVKAVFHCSTVAVDVVACHWPLLFSLFVMLLSFLVFVAVDCPLRLF